MERHVARLVVSIISICKNFSRETGERHMERHAARLVVRIFSIC